MSKSIIFAGFGGQGILFAGKLLAQTGMYTGKKVTWLPSYGPEMRGGTASCTVIISDSEIGSPITTSPDCAVVLNLPSYLKFQPMVKSGGIVIADGSMLGDAANGRNDVTECRIPATSMANEAKMTGLANVIAVGAFIAASKIFTREEIVATMERTIPEARRALLELNKTALDMGYNFVK